MRIQQEKGENPVNSFSVKDCLKTVRRIDLITKKRSEDLRTGAHRSLFKGRGIEIADIREYSAGDDIRAMDWKITARYNCPYVRIFNEDRERTIYLAIDRSGSGSFGKETCKDQKILEAAATIILSAEKNGDSAGLILFTDKIEKFIPAGKGRKHCINLINEIITHKPSSKKTDLEKAIRFIGHTIRRKSSIIIFSDFDSPGFKRSLETAGRKHEIQAVFVSDRNEFEIPDAGIIRIKDPETGEDLLIDTSCRDFRDSYLKNSRQFLKDLSVIFKKNEIRFAVIKTQDSYIQVLHSLELMAGDL